MKISEFRQRYIEAMKMSERSKIAELFRLADDLESVEKTEENYRILSDVFSYLGYYTKAYHYLSEVANPQDMKDAKKLYHLKDRLECEGDRPPSKSAAICNTRARAESAQKSHEKEALFVANKQEKTKEQRIRAEKARLKRIYKTLPKEAAGTVAGLIDQAAFMRVECEDMAEDLRENGWTEPFRQSERLEPYDRARPIGQAYNSTNANYQKIIKQLTTLLPKPDTAPRQEDDGFGSFVRERDEA
uniref:Uncharacterized protein n=1 Tax=Siphoviridae sp. cttpk5 TaxID=2826496 RepID=A0A8S5NJ96_9CAUD|nr:MAG TPA: hypothetical protein [Siphoviridae sp. cttpk5]